MVIPNAQTSRGFGKKLKSLNCSGAVKAIEPSWELTLYSASSVGSFGSRYFDVSNLGGPYATQYGGTPCLELPSRRSTWLQIQYRLFSQCFMARSFYPFRPQYHKLANSFLPNFNLLLLSFQYLFEFNQIMLFPSKGRFYHGSGHQKVQRS